MRFFTFGISAIVGMVAVTAFGGEWLHNGIELPDAWPSKDGATSRAITDSAVSQAAAGCYFD